MGDVNSDACLPGTTERGKLWFTCNWPGAGRGKRRLVGNLKVLGEVNSDFYTNNQVLDWVNIDLSGINHVLAEVISGLWEMWLGAKRTDQLLREVTWTDQVPSEVNSDLCGINQVISEINSELCGTDQVVSEVNRGLYGTIHVLSELNSLVWNWPGAKGG